MIDSNKLSSLNPTRFIKSLIKQTIKLIALFNFIKDFKYL